MFLGLLIIFLGLIEQIFFFAGFLIFIFPFFYLYAKAVDESCMVKKIRADKLTEGEWLYKDLMVGKKIIRAKWDGLSKKEIMEIKRNYREVKIRHGIPFTPVFLVSFLALIILLKIV